MPPPTTVGDLHDISLQIGRLQAEVEQATRSRAVTHQRLDQIDQSLRELTMLARDVAAMRPEVEHYADARRRMAGAVAVLTLLSGIVGAMGSEFLKLLMHR